MNHCTSKSELPQNIEPTAQDRQLRIDNLFAQMWGTLGLNGHLGRAAIDQAQRSERTRNGVSAADVALAARLFDRHVLSSLHAGIFQARKDAVYEFFKREDLNWRGLNYRVARAV